MEAIFVIIALTTVIIGAVTILTDPARWILNDAPRSERQKNTEELELYNF